MQRASKIRLQLKEAESSHEFIKSGFKTLDNFLHGGFIKKEMIIIGGNSGIGKSYVGGQIFFNVARQGFNCAYFSLEITNSMVYSRLVGAEANIMPTRIQFGLLKEEEFSERSKAETLITSYDEYMAFYDDVYTYQKLIDEIKLNKYEFVVIDFLQNLENGMLEERVRLAQISKDLQKAAKALNCCILVLSQQSNAAAREGAETSSLEFLGSGSIKHVCDLGFLVEREAIIEGKDYQFIKLILKKNRRGVADVNFPLLFKFPGGKIYES